MSAATLRVADAVVTSQHLRAQTNARPDIMVSSSLFLRHFSSVMRERLSLMVHNNLGDIQTSFKECDKCCIADGPVVAHSRAVQPEWVSGKHPRLGERHQCCAEQGWSECICGASRKSFSP